MNRRAFRVLFRVAAGPRIGFGHLMRCRALARALGSAPVVSVRGSRATRAAAETLGCRVHTDAARALKKTDVLVVDDPSASDARAWLRRARRSGVATATIRDGECCRVAADLVVDGSITAERLGQRNRLAGTAFTILDSRIAAARAKRCGGPRSKPASRVLIALGGGAQVFSVVPHLVRQINRLCPDAEINIAAGFSRAHRCPRVERARWIRRRSGLAFDLAACDVAIVGGGLTLYEACAVGAPAVGLAVVPAQRRAIAAFAACGAVLDAGSWEDGHAAVCRAAEGVASCLRDRAAATRRSDRARRLVDGYGAARVAARIQRLAQTRREGEVSHG